MRNDKAYGLNENNCTFSLKRNVRVENAQNEPENRTKKRNYIFKTQNKVFKIILQNIFAYIYLLRIKRNYRVITYE